MPSTKDHRTETSGRSRSDPHPADVKRATAVFAEARKHSQEENFLHLPADDPEALARGLELRNGRLPFPVTGAPPISWGTHPGFSRRVSVDVAPFLDLHKFPPYTTGYWERCDVRPLAESDQWRGEQEERVVGSYLGGAARGSIEGIDYEYSGASPSDGSVELAAQIGQHGGDFPVVRGDTGPSQSRGIFGPQRVVQAGLEFDFAFPGGPIDGNLCVQVDADLTVATTPEETGRKQYYAELWPGDCATPLRGLTWEWLQMNMSIWARGPVLEGTPNHVRTGDRYFEAATIENGPRNIVVNEYSTDSVSLKGRVFLTPGADGVRVMVAPMLVTGVSADFDALSGVSGYSRYPIMYGSSIRPYPGVACLRAVKPDKQLDSYNPFGLYIERKGCIWLRRLHFSFYDYRVTVK